MKESKSFDLKEYFKVTAKGMPGTINLDDAETLVNLVEQHRPGLFLEVGVASGTSSVAIANALRDYGGGELIAVDISDRWYADTSKPMGFMLDIHLPESLGNEVHLIAGKTAFDLEAILAGDRVDMVFIDASHMHPWPTLDTIAVLPLVRAGAIVAHHDLTLYRTDAYWQMTGPKFLYDQMPPELRGRGLRNSSVFYFNVPESLEVLEEALAESLMLPWHEGAQVDRYLNTVAEFVGRHYSGPLVSAVDKCLMRYKKK